ncbi:MAG: arylesterase [Saprospiraceae bacterium]|nr:arylesterase [Saprospiraceae bacterium]
MAMYFNKLAAIFLLTLAACGQSPTDNKENRLDEETEQGQNDDAASGAKRQIVFFGNSLTAAYGLEPEQGFPALIQAKIDSLGLAYKVINAGLSGETTAGGNERVDWILQQPVDVFVLELGGNDGLRGINPDATYANLQSIINKVKTKYPNANIILTGMEAPPNMGADFTKAFRQVFPRLAKENDLQLIPFLLDGVGGRPELNLPDGIHPNVQGQYIVADNVWEVLQPLL